MICRHGKLKCTDNVFYCLSCGARIGEQELLAVSEEKQPQRESSARKSPEKAGKRKAKKGDDNQ